MTPTRFDFAPFQLSGAVYGVLLNHAQALHALGDTASKPPYKAAPKAPVLYIKPRNTLAASGDSVVVPRDASQVEVGAALGIVIGQVACRVQAADAEKFIAGYTVVNDISIPHDSFYRPSLRFKVRDGFCPIGPVVVPRASVPDPDRLRVRVFIDDQLAQETATSGMLRPVAQLLADVTEFMTLSSGDVLMLGVAAGAPLARAGQRVAVEIDGVGRLENLLAKDAP
jgi:5-oxopent-3-ene-1,2,5-tricarboxylate decarboxylase / 2-hydroxyhepta-2,4-diene-1,7-dioate isomerase